MAGVPEERISEDTPDFLVKWNELLERILPVVLFILILYLVLTFLVGITHPVIEWVERIAIGYFIIELTVAFIIYDDKKQFFKEKWFHILLVLPLFTILRTAGRTLHLFRGGIAVVEGGAGTLQLSRFLRIPLAQRLIGGYRVARLTKYLKDVRNGVRYTLDRQFQLYTQRIEWVKTKARIIIKKFN